MKVAAFDNLCDTRCWAEAFHSGTVRQDSALDHVARRLWVTGWQANGANGRESIPDGTMARLAREQVYYSMKEMLLIKINEPNKQVDVLSEKHSP
ncbi:hypothetical protein ElyMa_001200500 [Elysia marginata]|uniref:Uncharacterized protein n=1 Tax=Elysia marginata TaxID=1093978 RepID=A0AAV4I8Y5_9GAST|nr:hypothetical protein ElyMa_001200500 [Elysia marginata]